MLPRRCSVREPSLTRPKIKQEWPSWSDLCRLCGRLSVVNPGFGDNELEGEAEPESSAKEIMGCKAGNDVNESEDGTLTVSWERILAQINVLRAFLVKFLNKL